jgi:azobenzene reductase
MNVLVLSGSPRPMSRTLLVAALLAQMLRREGARTTLWDLATRPVPVTDPDYHADPAANPDPVVRELVGRAEAADAFLLASPVYHNSFSGVLKNALDNLSIKQFEYKPVGLVAFGGSLAAVQVCDQLRSVVRGLRGLSVPTQLVAVNADFGTGDGGRPRIDNPELIRRGRQLIREMSMLGCPGSSAARTALAEGRGPEAAVAQESRA